MGARLELEIRHNSQIRLETLEGLQKLFRDRGFAVSTVRDDPGPVNMIGLPDAIILIFGYTIAE